MRAVVVLVAALVAGESTAIGAQERTEYRVLATSKTSTLQKELNEAGDAGFRFAYVMGGDTAIGGKEVVAVMQRRAGSSQRFEYRLLATNRTSTLQKELQQAADAGFEFRGQTVFESLLGGQEVACILERDRDATDRPAFTYLLVATSKTSTMQKELQDAGDRGYEILGLTVGKTAIGGAELVTILRKKLE